jgi:hypothetical protein
LRFYFGSRVTECCNAGDDVKEEIREEIFRLLVEEGGSMLRPFDRLTINKLSTGNSPTDTRK